MPIPQTVHVSAAVAQRQAYRGEVPLSSLSRLAALLANADGVLSAELQAGRDSGRDRLRGSVDARLALRCRRCEAVFDWPLHATVDVCLVHSEEEEQATAHDADPVLVDNDSLPLRELIEDEAMLALPMLPRCQSCENAVQALPETGREADGVGADAKANNPFAALKARLKSQQ